MARSYAIHHTVHEPLHVVVQRLLSNIQRQPWYVQSQFYDDGLRDEDGRQVVIIAGRNKGFPIPHSPLWVQFWIKLAVLDAHTTDITVKTVYVSHVTIESRHRETTYGNEQADVAEEDVAHKMMAMCTVDDYTTARTLGEALQKLFGRAGKRKRKHEDD